MSSIDTISRRYATALADVVMNTGESKTVTAELNTWERLFETSDDLQTVFGNPAIAHSKKEKILEGLIARSKPLHTTTNFLRVLLSNGRLTELSEINARLASVLEERSGVVSAEVASARELTEAQRNELKANLEKRTGKSVKLEFGVDPGLIGGVVTRVGSTIYDGSVRTQLENLREELVNG